MKYIKIIDFFKRCVLVLTKFDLLLAYESTNNLKL
jgi:hypothetical protein